MTPLAQKLEAQSIPFKLGAVLLGSWLIVAGAYIEVPMWPVPMTMQSMAVLIIGGAYGMRLAAATTSAYLVQGMIGLPVFAGGAGGFLHLLGPTGGYLFGFVLSATLIGYLCDRGWDKNILTLAGALFIGTAALFAAGIIWLSFFTGPMGAIQTGLLPFIPGLFLKLFLALGILKLSNKFVS